jgi:hypothetical protein
MAEIGGGVDQDGAPAGPHSQSVELMRAFGMRPRQLEHQTLTVSGQDRSDPRRGPARLERFADSESPAAGQIRDSGREGVQPALTALLLGGCGQVGRNNNRVQIKNSHVISCVSEGGVPHLRHQSQLRHSGLTRKYASVRLRALRTSPTRSFRHR